METLTNTHEKWVDVIIPTYDNITQLSQCIKSILIHKTVWPLKIIIINNGQAPLTDLLPYDPDITIVESNVNRGWTGGLKLGLEYSTSKYVVFANDDIFIPKSSYTWLRDMVRVLSVQPGCAAVGPSSNCVMGSQNIWASTRGWAFYASFLIGFCIVVDRNILDKVGGIDETFYTGDDIDLSIRFREGGYKMVVLPTVFVYHHGFQTGEKVHGKPEKPGGWNSRTMGDETNKHLIQKHGFIPWWKTMCKVEIPSWDNGSEDQVIKEVVGESDSIIELGCGHNKIFPRSLGVDLIPKGEEIPFVGEKSVADERWDVGIIEMEPKFKYVLAQQIIEHLTDPLLALQYWVKLMDEGGRLIISTPDEDRVDGINLNAQHKHVFTPLSLIRLGEMCGLKPENIYTTYDFFSFTIVFTKGER